MKFGDESNICFFSEKTSLSSSVLLMISFMFHRRMVKVDNLFSAII